MAAESGSTRGTSRTGGLSPAAGGALAYLFGFVSGLLLLSVASGEFVRFHAAQSVALSVTALLGSAVLGVFGGWLSALWWLACVVALVVAVVGAARGRRTRLPGAGALADRLLTR
jgi:uncharacterized membrane protein